jgi:hypothetical protein
VADEAWWSSLARATGDGEVAFAGLSDAQLRGVVKGVAGAVPQVQHSRGLAEVAKELGYLGEDTALDLAFGVVFAGRATFEAFLLGDLTGEQRANAIEELASMGEILAHELRDVLDSRRDATHDDKARTRWIRLLAALDVPPAEPSGQALPSHPVLFRAWRPNVPDVRGPGKHWDWFTADAVAWTSSYVGEEELPRTPENEQFARMVARVGVAIDQLFQGRLWRFQNELAGAHAEVRPVPRKKPPRLNRATLSEYSVRVHVDWPMPAPAEMFAQEWPLLAFLVEPVMRLTQERGWAPLVLHGVPAGDDERKRREAIVRPFLDYRRQIDPRY